MDFSTIQPDKSIALFVKNIFVFKEQESKQETVLPFFADGYPGLIFHETENGLTVQPHNKQMPLLFIYGQTIKPIELVLNGSYELICFQLYPFVLKSFFNVSPIDINDGCYNLEKLQDNKGIDATQHLQLANNLTQRVAVITDLLFTLFQLKKGLIDDSVSKAIQLILQHKGQLGIVSIASQLHLTERTFERRFLKEVGISPKQFSSIIQFQQSLEQLTVKDYTKLTDIVYANGFADQSHFIRVFKAFTGKTPRRFSSTWSS